MNYAVIGRNFVADWMVGAAAALPGLTPLACCSRTAEGAAEFANKHGIQRRYTDLAALAGDPDIDFVYIASPNVCHVEQSLMMINAGKHVLCEKPAALTVASLDRVTEAARKRGVVFMEGMVPVYMPAMDKLRSLVREIGTVRRVTLSFCQYSSRYDKFKRGIVENAFNPAMGGGAARDLGVYCLSLLLCLFGEPDRFSAESVTLPGSIDGEGTILARYIAGGKAGLSSDMLAEIIYSKIADRPLPSVIEGEDGCITIDKISRPHRLTLVRRAGSVPASGERPGFETAEEYDMTPPLPDMSYEIAAFVSQITSGIPDPRTASVTRSVCAITEQVAPARL